MRESLESYSRGSFILRSNQYCGGFDLMTEEITTLQIHYYFNDDSHSINTFVKNKVEKALLDCVKRIGEISDTQINVETQIYKEGGFIETFELVVKSLQTAPINTIVVSTLPFLSFAINGVIQHHFTVDHKKQQLEREKLGAEIESIKLDNTKKKLDNNEKELTHKIEEDKKCTRYVSMFYSEIQCYEKITKVGFSCLKGDPEIVIERSDFSKFILDENKSLEEDDDAFIEIISPVLEEAKYKWKGKYKNEVINFSMGDNKFKQEVINKIHQFSNGSTINCRLLINTACDDFGEKNKVTYSVQDVYGIQISQNNPMTIRKSKKERSKNDENPDQRKLNLEENH